MTTQPIESDIKDFILREFLPGEDPEELEATTPLITSGILDSIATLRLVAFLEERYRIKIAAHEAGIGHLNSIEDISSLVRSKGAR